MNDIHLLDTTGDSVADRVARGVVALFEAVFPARVVGYFVEGSFASQTAVTTSDLDLIIVFKSRFLEATERTTATRVSAACRFLSQLELDILITDEAELQHGADPLFKLGTRCLYGRDVRASIPLLPIAQWARQRIPSIVSCTTRMCAGISRATMAASWKPRHAP